MEPLALDGAPGPLGGLFEESTDASSPWIGEKDEGQRRGRGGGLVEEGGNKDVNRPRSDEEMERGSEGAREGTRSRRRGWNRGGWEVAVAAEVAGA